MADPYTTYQQLVSRAETLAQAIRQRYPEHITCHAGCDGCCYQSFTIFPVEAHHLAQALSSLPREARQRLQQHLEQPESPWRMADEPRPCVLLMDGQCGLYEGRPLICRLQGYPLFSRMIESPDGVQRDCCPLNFTDMALSDIDAQAVYNLDVVNQTLVAINHLFIQDHHLADQRLSMRQAVLQALASLAKTDHEERGM
jgi:uncharacterized protein